MIDQPQFTMPKPAAQVEPPTLRREVWDRLPVHQRSEVRTRVRDALIRRATPERIE